MKLNNEEMLNIKGGGIKGLGYIIGAAISFLIGLVEGIINPRKCN